MGKQRSKKRGPRGGAGNARRRFPGTRRDSMAAEVVRYEITEDWMPDPKIERLPRAVRDRIDRINESLYDNPQLFVAELEELIEAHPHVEKLYNYLALAYLKAARNDDVKSLVVRTYQRFPNYLFAIVNYAMECMRRHRLDEARAAFRGKFTLHELCGRRRFHLTEFLAFQGMMARYFNATGNRDQARLYYLPMREIAPDHPTTKRTAWLFRIPRFVQRLAGEIP